MSVYLFRSLKWVFVGELRPVGPTYNGTRGPVYTDDDDVPVELWTAQVERAV